MVSNHTDLERLAKSYGIPFHHVPVTPDTKPDAEAELLALVESLGIHLVVLARYMQILSDETCARARRAGRSTSTTRSCRASRARSPYQQAFDRGVKLIGATAHYVSPDLDEGPIIEQDVVRVDHSLSAARSSSRPGATSRARCSRARCAGTPRRRVLLNGNRTVVFR